MSPVCHNFVQNAWKKDFCSNCFKSRDEHLKQEKTTTDTGKYFATPFQNRSSFFKTSKSPTSILRIHPKKKSKRNVKFPEEVCSVIGYGGDDWSDDEEFQMSEDVIEDDIFPDTEEERELQKLTKSNTDFNTVKANLLGDLTGEARKSYTSLLLGKIQTDSDGKKKTLMVSVTPFGHDNNKTNKIKSHARKSAVIPITNCSSENTLNGYKTNIILSSFVKNNDTVISTKYEKKEMSEVVCTEKSLLEEISETLEQNRISAVSDLGMSQKQLSKPTVVDEHMKEDVTDESNEKRDTNETKKNGLVRNSPIIKNQERPKLSLTSRPEFKFCKINIESTSVDSAVSALSTNTINSSFTSDDDSFSGRTDSDNDDSGNFTEPVKSNDENLKIKIFNNTERSTETTDHSIEEVRKVDGQSDSLQEPYTPTYSTKLLNMPPIIPKMQTNELFSVEASRELAGEPDGRADPDEPSEAPALPTSPVPTTVDARPSFLHGMISDHQIGRPSIPEKPKLPVKPLSVLKQTTSKRTMTTPPQQQQVIMQLQQTLNASIKQEKEVIEAVDLTEELNNEITEIKEESLDTIYFNKPNLVKQDSNGSLNNMNYNNKRKAPMPPPSPSSDESAGAKFQRNPTANVKSDSPVVREKEKRERASSISIKTSPGNYVLNEEPSAKSYITEIAPEPAPRRNISLSHDNLLLDDKRKGKLKFSIKKLLRIGSSKDLDKKELSTATISKLALKTEEIYDLTPKPKPRLVIIHPLELNGSSVEVVKTTELPEATRRLSHDSESIYSGNSSVSDLEPTPQKVVNKPPPPPRSYSDDTKSNNSPSKPARPPPPKSAALQKKQKQQTWASSPPPPRPDSNIYANLGEVRSAIAPRKPERTASMREREAQLELPKRRTPLTDEKDDDEVSQENIVEATNDEVIHNYDDVYNSVKYDDSCTEDNNDSAKNSDSDYEYVNHARSSSPECDSGIKKTEETPENRLNYGVKEISFRKSAEDASSEYVKYTNGMFNRSSSLPYCGSETESEIYSPYSFYSSADIDGSACNDDYGGELTSKNTTSKLRVRKGRSVVHKNLEDNYGAVVIANHEALAQVLEQIQQSATMQPSLRGLKASTNLRWNDFTLTQTASLSQSASKNQFIKCGKRLFYPAVWNSNTLGAVNVTLMLHKEQMASQIVSQQSMQPQTLSLNAVTEFCDLVPLQQFGEEGEDLVQATIVVLAHTQVDTIQSYGTSLYSSESVNTKEYLIQSEQAHEATFMMLQLINGLKFLQARGIEEIPDSLTSFIILRESQSNIQGSTANLQASEDRLSSISAPKTNNYGRLCILQGLSEDINCNKSSDDEQLHSLCKCATSALEILLPGDKLNPLLKELLHNERAVSLSQAKAVLEFSLWGPLDVVQGVPVKERELSLQRWLDLERATVLHGLVRTRVQLNAFEQLHLMFLVRSSAKAMCDASVLVEKANVY